MRGENTVVRVLVSLGWLLCAIPFKQEPLEVSSTLEIFTVQGGFAAWGLLATTAAMFLVAREAYHRVAVTARAQPGARPTRASGGSFQSALSTWIGSTRVAR
jgi:hypothetical protein